MNKKLLSVIFGGLSVCAMPALANTGTITFDGSITSNTCNTTVNGSGTNTVTLPPVSADLLANSGDVAGLSGFTIDLSGCTGSLQTASAFFEPGATVNTDGRLTTAGTATNVDIQLLDGSNANAPIVAGNTNQVNGNSYVSLSSGTASLPYAARYYATGQAGAGDLTTSVTYSIQYK